MRPSKTPATSATAARGHRAAVLVCSRPVGAPFCCPVRRCPVDSSPRPRSCSRSLWSLLHMRPQRSVKAKPTHREHQPGRGPVRPAAADAEALPEPAWSWLSAALAGTSAAKRAPMKLVFNFGQMVLRRLVSRSGSFDCLGVHSRPTSRLPRRPGRHARRRSSSRSLTAVLCPARSLPSPVAQSPSRSSVPSWTGAFLARSRHPRWRRSHLGGRGALVSAA